MDDQEIYDKSMELSLDFKSVFEIFTENFSVNDKMYIGLYSSINVLSSIMILANDNKKIYDYVIHAIDESIKLKINKKSRLDPFPNL